MKTVSWVLLGIVACLIVLGGAGSAGIAYLGDGSNDIITQSVSVQSVGGGEDVTLALRGRRGTAAAFGLAFATLLLFVILGPYRKGEVWAWWAILCSTAVLSATILLRIPTLGISGGTATGWGLLLLVIIGLLLDVKRLGGRRGLE